MRHRARPDTRYNSQEQPRESIHSSMHLNVSSKSPRPFVFRANFRWLKHYFHCRSLPTSCSYYNGYICPHLCHDGTCRQPHPPQTLQWITRKKKVKELQHHNPSSHPPPKTPKKKPRKPPSHPPPYHPHIPSSTWPTLAPPWMNFAYVNGGPWELMLHHPSMLLGN